MTEADETVDEMEILSVDEFILLLSRPKRLPVFVGKEPPLALPCRPECKFEAEDAAHELGRTGEAPLGGVRGSAVEWLVSLDEELLVKLALPTFPLPRVLEDELLFSSERDRALRSLFLNMFELFVLPELAELAVMLDEALLGILR
jgi:hypothetical protein